MIGRGISEISKVNYFFLLFVAMIQFLPNMFTPFSVKNIFEPPSIQSVMDITRLKRSKRSKMLSVSDFAKYICFIQKSLVCFHGNRMSSRYSQTPNQTKIKIRSNQKSGEAAWFLSFSLSCNGENSSDVTLAFEDAD